MKQKTLLKGPSDIPSVTEIRFLEDMISRHALWFVKGNYPDVLKSNIPHSVVKPGQEIIACVLAVDTVSRIKPKEK